MKIQGRVYVFLFSILIVFLLGNFELVYAQSKKNYSISGDTLFITGKIPSETMFENSKKVKKIIVDKKVKRLPIAPFNRMKKTYKLKVSSELRWLDEEGDVVAAKDFVGDTVEFSTPIQDIRVIRSYDTAEYIVASNDPNYKSMDGLIYNKAGTKLVGVPSYLTEIRVAEGCKTVDFAAFMYMHEGAWKECAKIEDLMEKGIEIYKGEYIKDEDAEPISACLPRDGIYFPASVKKYICTIKKKDMAPKCSFFNDDVKVHIKNKGISGKSLSVLYQYLDLCNFNDPGNGAVEKRLCRMFKEQLKWKGDFLIFKGNYLLSYRGCKETVTIPKGIKDVDKNALANYNQDYYDMIQRVNYPSSYKKNHFKAFHPSKVRKWNHINQMEIHVTNDSNTWYSYCYHSCGKTVKLVAEEDGELMFSSWRDIDFRNCGVTFYDQEGNKITKMEHGIATVKKGDVIYAKINKKSKRKSSNIVADLGMLYIRVAEPRQNSESKIYTTVIDYESAVDKWSYKVREKRYDSEG